MTTTITARPAQTVRHTREPSFHEPTKRALVTNGDATIQASGNKRRRLNEPFVRDSDYILRKHKGKPPSLIIHLHPTHFRFDGQDGSFAYDSPMRFIVQHLRKQTVPHEMLEELWAENVPFYDGCLIVEVHNHRTTSAGSERSRRADSGVGLEPVKFSMHNYNVYVTPSPFVAYPKKAKEESRSEQNGVSDENLDESSKRGKGGPKITTIVLHPTALTRHHELLILANTPLADARSRKTTDGNQAQGTGSRTSNAKNNAGQAPKMCLSAADLYTFQSDLLVTTQPPLCLEPAKDLADSTRIVEILSDPLHREKPPSPRARKRTTAEMAADDAQAAEEERRMLIMDERIKPKGTGSASNDNQSAAASLGFSRFKTLEMVREKHEEQERVKKEEEARLAVERKANEEHNAQKNLHTARQREMVQQAQQRQSLLLAQQQTQRVEQLAVQQQMAEAQRHAQMARNDMQQPAMMQHPHAASFHQAQAQAQSAAMSPVPRQQTPLVNSSPMVRMAQTSSQGPGGSPSRPTSAATQQRNGSMARQVSQQQHPSQHNTPQMPQVTPNMAQVVPNRQMSQTPRMPPGSPANGLQGTPTTQTMMMPTPVMNAGQVHLTPEQVAMLQAQKANQQGMHAGSPLQGLTPEQLQNIRAQQAQNKQQAAMLTHAYAAAQANGNTHLANQYLAARQRHMQMTAHQQQQQLQIQNGQGVNGYPGLAMDQNGNQVSAQMAQQRAQNAMANQAIANQAIMAVQNGGATPQQHAIAMAKASQIQAHRQTQQHLNQLHQQYGSWTNIPANVISSLPPNAQNMLRIQFSKQHAQRQQQLMRTQALQNQQQQQQQQASQGQQVVPAGSADADYMQMLRANQASLLQNHQMRQQQQQQAAQQHAMPMNGMPMNMAGMGNMGPQANFANNPGADLSQHFANMQNALNQPRGPQNMGGTG